MPLSSSVTEVSVMLSTSEWAQRNFGTCDLGDKRRTQRIVKVAQGLADNPATSLCDQMESWSDVKAAYRLFDSEQVTFKAVAGPHWELTKQRAQGRTLIINDTTELDFGGRRKIAGLGPVGNGSGQGFLVHNALMVNASTLEILGVAGQAIHYRKRKTKKPRLNASQRLALKGRESELWGTVIDQIGSPSEQAKYVHVCDRGADNFEVYCHLQLHHCDWVIRASKLSRTVLVGDSQEPQALGDYLKQLPLFGEYQLNLRARPGLAARSAKLKVHVGKVLVRRPRHVSPWVRDLKQPPIAMNVIEVAEVDPPQGVTGIRWVLFTSLPVTSFDEAWTVIEYYEHRWLVEEYHKALKSGCRSESVQLKTADRLEAFIGLTSVVALRLLQMKSEARKSPEKPAKTIVPAIVLKMLQLARKKPLDIDGMTVGQFYREIAKLGGFLGRTGDCEPGWITLWRGWEKLIAFIQAAERLKRTA